MRIRIQNFQSIRDVSFDIEGFTVVVGNSNIGKSAIIRAIYSAFRAATGTHFVRTGAPFASVDIEDDDLHVLWEKGPKGVNRYVINRDPIPDDKVGRVVPEAILNAGYRDIVLREDKSSKIRLTPQFAHQRDGNYFLLDQNPSVVAEVLAQLSRLEVMMKATKGAESDITRLKKDSKLRSKDLIEVRERVGKFSSFGEASRRIDEIRDQVRKLYADRQKVEAVRKLEQERSVTLEVLRTLVEVPPLSSLPFVQNLVQVSDLQPSLLRARQAVRCADMIPEPQTLPDPGRYFDARVADRVLRVLRPTLNVPIPLVPDLPSLGAIQEVSGAQALKLKAVHVGAAVENEATAVESEKVRAAEELRGAEEALGKCPTCERVFDHGHV